MPEVAHIPEELTNCPQWVVWKFAERDGKPTKIPFQPNGTPAKTDDETTWSEFSAVLSCSGFDGVGFVFSQSDPFFGIDLDACRNPDDGQLTDWAREIVDDFQTYTEVSPSQCGVKLIGRGHLPDDVRRPQSDGGLGGGRVKNLKDVPTFGDGKKPEIAVWDHTRYWTITGDVVDGVPGAPTDCQSALSRLCTKWWGQETPAPTPQPNARVNGDLPPWFYDAMRERDGAPDRSTADYSLLCKAVEYQLPKESVWLAVKDFSKFAERGRVYFDSTWDNATQSAHPNGSTAAGATAPSQGPQAEEIKYRRITSAELDAGEFELKYLVRGVLVEGQPCLMAGPHKCLKTNMLVDLAISLATGGRFLGYFDVPEAIRVGIMSGESGLSVLQETARRIAHAAGANLADIGSNLIWSNDLPKFSDGRHLFAFQDFIVNDELKCIIIDPAYLAMAMPSDRVNNLFAVGEHLRGINRMCDMVGCTLVIAHHMRKSNLNYDPPELADAAWSGWAEWARQWLLLNRREPFDPDSNGEHSLWFAVGGSAGHSGLWGLDVSEGRRDDPEGRFWDVEFRSASEVRSENQQAAGAEKRRQAAEKLEADVSLVARALDAHPAGATKTTLREHCGMSGTRFGRALAVAMDRNIAEPADVTVANHRKPRQGYRRVKDAD